MSMSMRNTKAELLAYIAALEGRLQQGGRDMQELRHRISVLEGALQLKQPVAEPKVVRMHGVDHRVEIERHGARTTKRYIPLS